ncbi:MAG: type II secretion system F family protein [Desulfurivibrionaceae bacterium]|nr:type II secretion system F family protein [Desulfobulbales bacterium]MDT8335260.1 type II secretion system F family protein [Desulfurivibrionaceae bacterium]
MDQFNLFFLAVVFLFAMALILFVYFLWGETKFAEKRTMRKRLLYISAGGKHGKEKLELYKNRVLKDTGVFELLAFKLPRISSIDRMLIKTGKTIPASVFYAISILAALIGALLAYQFMPGKATPFVAGLFFLFVPYFLLKMYEDSIFEKFQDQLPEALDLLARAMRSGHALTSGLEMIAEEMPPPIQLEFRATVDEINMGLSVKDALANMCERVPSTDLRFFAIAILIQRETGGNVAEILDKIGRLIRERLQFRRQVKTLTAEGRISARILLLLPIFMFMYIYFVNYEYISLLWTEKIGIYMLVGGIVMQVIGTIFIRNIVKIEI